MDRHREISKVVGDSLELLLSIPTHRQKNEISMIDQLQLQLRQTVKLLCTHQDYTDHLPNLADNFGRLPNEIAHDVVELASFEQQHNLGNLALTDGSWAEFSQLALNESSLRYSLIEFDCLTDCNQLKATAPKLYETLQCRYISGNMLAILDSFGTRFVSVSWYQSTYYDYKMPKQTESEKLKVINFLTRQLKSKYLRIFSLREKYEIVEALNEHLLNFVQRPRFETLVTNCQCELPFQVFQAAHKAWEAATHFEVRRKVIYAQISGSTLQEVRKYFKYRNTTLRVGYNTIRLRHPVHSTAIAVLKAKKDDRYILTLEMTLFCLENEDDSDESLNQAMSRVELLKLAIR